MLNKKLKDVYKRKGLSGLLRYVHGKILNRIYGLPSYRIGVQNGVAIRRFRL